MAAVLVGLEPQMARLPSLIPSMPDLLPTAVRLGLAAIAYLAVGAVGWRLIRRNLQSE